MFRSFALGLVLLLVGAPASPETPNTEPPERCTVVITTAEFDRDSHDLEFWEDGRTLIKIDGADFSGSDGHVPRHEIRSIELRLQSSRYRVSPDAFRRLFEPFPSGKDCSVGCTLLCDPTAPVVLVHGGDGAGAYHAIFIFSPRGGFVERVLSENPNPEAPSLKHFDLKCMP